MPCSTSSTAPHYASAPLVTPRSSHHQRESAGAPRQAQPNSGPTPWLQPTPQTSSRSDSTSTSARRQLLPRTPRAAADVVSAAGPAAAAALPISVAFPAMSIGAAGLWGTCACMFVGAYCTGMLPLWAKFDAAVGGLTALRLAGAGLLLGSGLGIVIPEGFHSFADGAQAPDAHELPEWLAGATLLAGFALMLLLELYGDHGHGVPPGPAHGYKPVAAEIRPTQSLHELHHDGGGASSTALGIVSADQEVAEARSSGGDCGSGDGGMAVHGAGRAVLNGLLVHSAADGVAVGAASLSSSLSLNATVALAILLHKLPVSFGLTSSLKASGWTRERALKGLLAFSASAPAAAILFHYVLSALPGMGHAQAPALALLFSGGTFLYAGTVHILPAAMASLKAGRLTPYASSSSAEGGTRAAAGTAPAAAATHDHGLPGVDGPAVARRSVALLLACAVLPLVIAALVPEDV